MRQIREEPRKQCLSGIWIGYKRNGTAEAGTIRWSDTADNVLSYSNWLPTQPKNSGSQSCAQILDIGLHGPFKDTFSYPASFVPGWVDQDCDAKQYFVCQYQAGDHPEEIPCNSANTMVLALSIYLFTAFIFNQ